MKKFFTSESVTEGHPDKICDQISDAVLDAIIEKDPNARVACECCTTTGLVLIMGEITTESYVDIPAIAKETIREIGYDNASFGFDANTCAVITSINSQSADIALGVDNSVEHRLSGDAFDRIGAGDQGMMFGYACNETEEYMPLALMLAHKLTRRLAEVRKTGLLGYLRPDGKSQVTVEYDGNTVKRIDAVVVSTQHSESVTTEKLREDVKKYVIEAVLPKEYLDGDTKYFINPTGRFEIGGPHGDSGLTGRKIIVDTYGGRCSHGGGAFSGKDPTKVDRSAAYMARYICKNIVAAGLAEECTLEVAYAIGVAKPVSLFINTNGTGKLPDGEIADIVEKEFDLRPAAIIKALDLLKPVYKNTAAYGHFGRSGFSWEKTDRVNDLKKYLR
ncbi:MAG: methionine adenosyltransferase [Clostridia bacterium]|nr:methionine adenosyltransferase [Clostridia bacterium]MBQ9481736.1 methionine adenosyltransferase [Clostridia bacterium]